MAEQTKVILSVIIPSYNRKDEIQELLTSLDAQDLDKDQFEVVVVDDGSTDGTDGWIYDFSKTSDLDLSFIRQNHQGPGAARNLGMQTAKGDVFVFIDSDCLAPSNWLSLIAKTFAEDPQVQAFGGRDDALADFPPLLLAINYSMTSFLTTGGMRGGAKKRLAKFYPRSFNMGLHRNLYEQIGGFGTLRHGQDIEFSNRIIKSGATVAYLPESVVYHKRRTSLRKFFRQVFNWGVARINLFKIDSKMLEPLHIAPALGFWFIVALTFWALIFPAVFAIWKLLAMIALSAIILSAVHAAIKWKNIKAGLLVPIVMPIQIVAYGLGFSIAFCRRVLLGEGEFTGFVKKYYR
ncbi:glycosyltransferase [candidate division KSB1 bacterium]|nr:glycosyltransferase [candidate division KSB1 bacterium]RQW05382.1 MAG: glycosyltransferase [candidate division KSB1 bacterium]